MKIGLYPGSFDPITNGHIDIIERASKMFDKLYVAIGINSAKNYTFSFDERVELIKESTAHIKNVEVIKSNKLIVDTASEVGATALIRGLRAVTDFEYEFQIATTNNTLNKDIDTIFLMTKAEYSYLSSSLIKEIAKHRNDLSKFVPSCVEDKLIKKLK